MITLVVYRAKAGAGGTHDEHEDDDEDEDDGAQDVEYDILPVVFQPITEAVDVLVALAEPVKRGKSFFFHITILILHGHIDSNSDLSYKGMTLRAYAQ